MEARRQLVLSCPGIALEHLDPETAPTLHSLWSDPETRPLVRNSIAPIGTELQQHGFVAGLRRAALSVDRRGWTLRSPGRSDMAALETVLSRPHGPADVTLFELRDPAVVAMRAGMRSAAFRTSVSQSETILRRLLDALRAEGRTPQLTALCHGPMEDVRCTIDPVAHLQRRLPRRLRRAVAWDHDIGSLRLECSSGKALEAARAALVERREVDRILDCADASGATHLRPGQMIAIAAPGIGFGSQRTYARLPNLPSALSGTADGLALCDSFQNVERHLSVAGLAARVLMNASALVPEPQMASDMAEAGEVDVDAIAPALTAPPPDVAALVERAEANLLPPDDTTSADRSR